MLMMRPPSSSRSAASWQPYSVPLMLTATTASICSSVASSTGVSGAMAALLTRMSIFPNASLARSNKAANSSRWLMSAWAGVAAPPASRMPETTAPASSSCAGRWLTTTAAPSAPRRAAMPLPIPVAAPVTIATLSSSRGELGPVGPLLKPVVEGDRRLLAELGAEAAIPAKPAQLSCAGAGDHEPFAPHGVRIHRAGVLEQKRASAALDAARHALDPDEARRLVLAHRLKEAGDSFALDVAAKGLRDVNLAQARPSVNLRVRLRLVRLDVDPTGCVRLARRAHGISLL